MNITDSNNILIRWLLEDNDIGVRYLTMRDLIPTGVKELMNVRKKAHSEGPISAVLSNMEKEGYWVEPGPGYYPKYTGTVWSIILLAQLGASINADKRVATACSYLLRHALTENGHFTINGFPSGTADCLQGNLCAALLDLGYEDSCLDNAFTWMARSVTGEGIASMENKNAPLRYYAGKCGPNFACGSNNKLPCAWGAIKVMLAFGKLPENRKNDLINNAIKTGLNFLFSTDPAEANYPCGYSNKPSSNWWKFGFPVFYVTDLLQNVEVITSLGFGKDHRLEYALDIIRNKQDSLGR